jgi:FtsH-binding integral membrane protein
MTVTPTAGGVRDAIEVPSAVAREERHLRWTATFFALAVLIHNSDHVRRGADAVNLDVFWAGTLALTLEVSVVIIVFLRHRLAPLAAIAAGFPLALGYVVVHFTPDHGLLSDSLLSSGKVVSIVAAGLETVSAIALGAVGALIVRRRGLASFADGARSEPTSPVALRLVLRHPVVVALIAGNAIILAVSFVQLTR